MVLYKQRIALLSVMVLAIAAFGFILPPPGDDFRKVENKAFREGEKLTFDVKYGFVHAGVATMSIPQTKRISGRDAYHIVFEVSSVPSFDWVFKVRDRYETYVDALGIFPWRFEQHVREGKYSIPRYVNDIMSAFYYARTIDYSKMKVGDRVKLYNFYKDKVYDLDVRYLGKERIKVSAGTFDCIMVEPLVQEGGLFKSEGNIIIWLTNDDIKMPVKVKTKIVIGSIDAELTAYEGLYGRLNSKR